MKKLTYFLLFIWNFGFGQNDELNAIYKVSVEDTALTISEDMPIDQGIKVIRHKLFSDSSGNYIVKYIISGGGYLPLVVGAEEHSYSEIEVYKIHGNDTIKIGTTPIGGVFVESGCFEDIPSEHIKDAYNSVKAKNLIIGQKATNTYGVINETPDIDQDTPLVRASNTTLTLGFGGKVELSDSVVYDTGATINLSDFPGYSMTVSINGISDTNTIIEYRGFERHEFNTFKYDTVKAVLMVSDSADEVITNVFRNGEEIKIGGIRYSDTYFYWLYGYVIIQSEFCMISCPDGMPGCLVAHYGYGNKKTIGYLDSSKQPFSKDYIIWDYKIIE